MNYVKTAILLAGLTGLFMGIGRTSRNFVVRTVSSVYVEGVRGLPLLQRSLVTRRTSPPADGMT